MRFSDYLRDSIPVLLLNFAGAFSLCCFLFLVGNSAGTVFLIAAAWACVLLIWLLARYLQRRKYFDGLFSLVEALEQPYLLSEIMERPDGLEDSLYHQLLHRSGKSVIEKVHQLEAVQQDYKDYIESWVHEIKTPITAARLICENHKTTETARILSQLSQVENQVEMVLYYARLEHANKDYHIHSICLRDVVLSTIRSQKELFLLCGMSIDCNLDDTIIETDEKWLEFLLKQIFANSRKYRPEKNALLTIWSAPGNHNLSLFVEDNGLGIPPGDLKRIFEKGFTGENGRLRQSSTGMGLYLCHGLCEKLGITVDCKSVRGEYTRMILTFPHTDHQKILQK